jgi:hypothetical protein
MSYLVIYCLNCIWPDESSTQERPFFLNGVRIRNLLRIKLDISQTKLMSIRRNQIYSGRSSSIFCVLRRFSFFAFRWHADLHVCYSMLISYYVNNPCKLRHCIFVLIKTRVWKKQTIGPKKEDTSNMINIILYFSRISLSPLTAANSFSIVQFWLLFSLFHIFNEFQTQLFRIW